MDWEVRPTYRSQSVPYYLAPLWDSELAARSAARKKRESEKAKGIRGASDTADNAAAGVPREFREKLKRARAAKALLQDLEETVRAFVTSWEEKRKRDRLHKEKDGLDDAHSSDEDEVVFVGRNGAMSDMRGSYSSIGSLEEASGNEKLVFDSLEADHGASFGYVAIHSRVFEAGHEIY